MDVKRLAFELQQNELLPVLIDELRSDVIALFPSTPPEGLEKLQMEYGLVEKLASKIENALHREIGNE